MLEFLEVPFLVPYSYIGINEPPDDTIYNIAIYADDTTFYSKCDQAFDFWQHVELTSELESGLRDTVDRGRK